MAMARRDDRNTERDTVLAKNFTDLVVVSARDPQFESMVPDHDFGRKERPAPP